MYMPKYNLPVNYDELTRPQRREVREQYIHEQNYVCFYCGVDIYGPPRDDISNKSLNLRLFPHNFLDNPIHLQHDHNTNMTEGAVHAYCNGVMWQYDGR